MSGMSQWEASKQTQETLKSIELIGLSMCQCPRVELAKELGVLAGVSAQTVASLQTTRLVLVLFMQCI